jgi:hypothetical protein
MVRNTTRPPKNPPPATSTRPAGGAPPTPKSAAAPPLLPPYPPSSTPPVRPAHILPGVPGRRRTLESATPYPWQLDFTAHGDIGMSSFYITCREPGSDGPSLG